MGRSADCGEGWLQTFLPQACNSEQMRQKAPVHVCPTMSGHRNPGLNPRLAVDVMAPLHSQKLPAIPFKDIKAFLKWTSYAFSDYCVGCGQLSFGRTAGKTAFDCLQEVHLEWHSP